MPNTGDELVVGGKVLDGLLVLALLKDQTGTHKRQVQDHIDLVEGKPVLHQTLVAGEDRGREVLVEVDELAVAPAAVLLDEVNRAVEVRDGHERLNAVHLTLAEHVLVEAKPASLGSVSSPLGKMRVQARLMRKVLKPISAKRAMSSL